MNHPNFLKLQNILTSFSVWQPYSGLKVSFENNNIFKLDIVFEINCFC